MSSASRSIMTGFPGYTGFMPWFLLQHPGARCVVAIAALLSLSSVAAGGQSPTAASGTTPAAARARSAPSLDTTLLAAGYARAAQLPRLRSLLVAREGVLVRERYFNGATAARRANIKSASKSVLSAVVGIAIHNGHLEGVDQTIGEFFPRELAQSADPRKRAITIEDLLTMRTGLETTSFYNYGRWVTSRHWVQHILAKPIVAERGRRGPMIYSTGSTHLLSAILTKASGMSTRAYANRYLARPLGIALPAWPRDPQGIYFGGNDMYLTPRAMLAFGNLYLRGGRTADGRQVVPKAWIDSSFVVRTHSGWSGNDYGYGWWIRDAAGHRVYYAWGYGGQFIFIVPSLGLTVVATSDAEARSREHDHLAAVYDLLERYIVPAAIAAR